MHTPIRDNPPAFLPLDVPAIVHLLQSDDVKGGMRYVLYDSI